MPQDLQQLVDSLARRLHRSVAIDDPQIHLLAHSAHEGEVDKVRLTSVLTRTVPDEVRKWAFNHGIATSKRAVRLPKVEELGVETRVCVPIRQAEQLLGFLWLIDADNTLTDAEIEAAEDAAGEAAAVLYRDRILADLQLSQQRELVRDLLADDPELRRHAQEGLLESDLIMPAKAYFVTVVRPQPSGGAELDDDVITAINATLKNVVGAHPRRSVVGLARPDHFLVLASAHVPGSTPRDPRTFGADIGERATAGWPGPPDWRMLVGVGNLEPHLSSARTSYQQALQAARVAGIVPSFGAVAVWSQLGIYSMLAQFPIEQLTSEALPSGLVKLLDLRDHGVLVATLETYLDRGCNVAQTAELMNIHRVSLYGRLRRIEEVTGADLNDGEQRLALHLGLKLARLAGLRA